MNCPLRFHFQQQKGGNNVTYLRPDSDCAEDYEATHGDPHQAFLNRWIALSAWTSDLLLEDLPDRLAPAQEVEHQHVEVVDDVGLCEQQTTTELLNYSISARG
jgi:hypothetical protein